MCDVKWDDKYSTGDDSLDYEHKIIFNIIEKITSSNEDFKELEKILHELEKYTKAHFINEEAFMESIGFKDFSSHKETHQEMFEKIIVLSDTKKFPTAKEFKNELIAFIENVFLNHVVEDDSKIHQHVEENLIP